jgi:protein FrlC
MKISGATLVFYRYSLLKAIHRIERLGYNAVEIWEGTPHAFYADMTFSKISETKAVIDDFGLDIFNFIPVQFRYPVNIAASDEVIRQRSVDYLKKNIDLAIALNSPYVNLCPGFSV